MNKRTTISASNNTILRLKVLAKKRESVRGKLVVTAKEKENARGKLAITAKQLAVTAKEKESIRRKLEITAENLDIKAKQLAITAKEKEDIRSKLAVTAEKLRLKAENLAVTAKEKESIKRKLEVTAKTLRFKAKQLAVTAKEKESIKRKLEVTARNLAKFAKEKESVRRKLVVTAEKLRLKAENLAVVAKERENARGKLAITAKQLAVTAKGIESANKYARSLIEASLDPLVTISAGGKITDVNAATIKVTGVSRKKLIGTDFSNYFIEPKKALQGYKQVFREGSVTDYPLTLRSQTGKLTDVLYNASVYKDDKGSVLGVFAAARDVTEAKKANEFIESANKELRSLDLAKDEFVSIASHQLRTPLTSLKGYTGMLLDGDAGPINDKQREYLEEIKIANNRMIALITALLNVSRVDLGVFVVEPEPVNLETVAESVLKELENNIQYKKLQVKTSFEKGIPLLNVDPKITRMIFQNLLSNAMKYTPREGRISLNIKKDGLTLLISVADTGCGVPKNVQSKIFTKLFRADNARIKDPSGTGLGLYIIKATIEKTGGKIWFESKENKGSTFYVSIPLKGMKKKEGSKRLE